MTEDLKWEDKLPDVWDDFVDFLYALPEPIVLVGHNCLRFDLPVLSNELKRYECEGTVKHMVSRLID